MTSDQVNLIGLHPLEIDSGALDPAPSSLRRAEATVFRAIMLVLLLLTGVVVVAEKGDDAVVAVRNLFERIATTPK